MKPLEGVKVVELATYFAGPSCARILADWGADVIKVESPAGDPYREAYKGQRTPAFDEGCPSFDAENSNKRFISLDTKTPEGREALLKLVDKADIFLTNNRYKALQKMGLTYEDISARCPRIIYAEVLGYGAKGPLKDKPGYDYTVFFSRSGFMADLSPKGKDVMNTIAGFGDHVCGITLAAGICAALFQVKMTGKGEHVTTSLYQSAVFLLSNGLLGSYYGREYPRAREDCNSPLLQAYRCKDGEWVFLSMPEYNKMWPKICTEIFDRPELATDPRFHVIAECNKHISQAVEILSKIFVSQDSAYWIERMEAKDIAHEKLAHFEDVLKDEQAWVNDYLLEYTYPGGDKCVFANTPVTFNSIEKPSFSHGKAIGQDTIAVLSQLGYTEEQLKAMLEQGAIKQA